jgi:hypothetical protein
MDCNVSNDMSGTHKILPLAPIEEDLGEIDNNGKKVVLKEF